MYIYIIYFNYSSKHGINLVNKYIQQYNNIIL